MESGCASTTHGIGGFTLLELLITVGVAAILASIGLPAMATFVENYRQNNAAASLITSLNYARNEAIKEDVSGGISVCASVSGNACDSANWAAGWIVMTPNPQTPGENVLQKVGALSTGLTLTATPANATILFQANGTAPALSVNGGISRAMFKLCDTRGAGTAREIEISQAGIIQAAYKRGYDVSGLALTCP